MIMIPHSKDSSTTEFIIRFKTTSSQYFIGDEGREEHWLEQTFINVLFSQIIELRDNKNMLKIFSASVNAY